MDFWAGVNTSVSSSHIQGSYFYSIYPHWMFGGEREKHNVEAGASEIILNTSKHRHG